MLTLRDAHGLPAILHTLDPALDAWIRCHCPDVHLANSQISAALDAFSEEYRKLKAPRKLQWKPSLGSVQLVVSAGGVQRELRVTALQVQSPGQVVVFPQSSVANWMLLLACRMQFAAAAWD